LDDENSGIVKLIKLRGWIILLVVIVGIAGLLAIVVRGRQETEQRPTDSAISGQVDPDGLAETPQALKTAPADEPTPSQQAAESSPTIEPESTTASATAAAPAAADVTEAPDPTESTPTGTAAPVRPADPPDGALIGVTMDSRVGVLLDEVPLEMRDQVVDALLERPESFWRDLAGRQVRLTKRRLNFRNFVYGGKGQLPLPPEELWSIRLDPAGPERQEVDGHDLLTIAYSLSGTLLTGEDSPGRSEPALEEVGGRWEEPFVLPVDPDLLLQRTGNTCLNEAGFPPNSFDSENAYVFFDYTCQPDSIGVRGCHRSLAPSLSCLEALVARVGVVETAVAFERLEWDDDLAGEVRLGEVKHEDVPDLKVLGERLETNRVIYRYFPPDSCALAENCVVSGGWRRLLQFEASVQNVGGEALDVGPVVSEDPARNLFQFNSCHAHFHFSDYGDFIFSGAGEDIASKQAFCVESTDRLSNNEWSPLTHSFSCSGQGIQAGWIDEYHSGLDCQWIDITEATIPADSEPVSLGFTSNPDHFLCEGTPVFDDEGNRVWEPSGLTTEDGREVERPKCDLVSDWDANNHESLELSLSPNGSFVTEPCAAGELGPLRNCGFTEQLNGITALPATQSDSGRFQATRTAGDELESPFDCTPGQEVQLSCTVEDGAAAQVLRICEYSQLLGTGVACARRDALTNATVAEEATAVTFTCPFQRDQDEPGGSYTIYTAPIYDESAAAPVSCTVR
jgi:hypothetical protein